MNIDVTNVDLVLLAQTAFNLSRPQGMGFLHSDKDHTLSKEEAESMMVSSGNTALYMDYVHGRAIKLTVFRDKDGTLRMNSAWYDHTDEQQKQLCEAVGVEFNEGSEHGMSCNCDPCRCKRGEAPY